MPAHFVAPLLAALIGFAALWPVSVRRRDASIVDFAWGPGFVIQVGIAIAFLGGTGANGWIAFSLIAAWSVRLGVVMARRRLQEGSEDARYTAMRESRGDSFWWRSLFIVFLLQAGLQWLIAIGPVAIAASTFQATGWLTWVGGAIALSGLVLETVADAQLDKFKRKAAPSDLLADGLRAHVRHPNYSGEILFWTGIALIGLQNGIWISLISPVLLAFFLLRVSGAPLLDERLSETRPDYADYRASTPAFIPRFGR